MGEGQFVGLKFVIQYEPNDVMANSLTCTPLQHITSVMSIGVV
jgi:hypothetical protein